MAPETPDLDDEDDDEPTALEEACFAYQDAGLRLPPIPRQLVEELDEFADWRWGSDNINLEDREGLIEAARQPGGEDEVAFGHIGHGVSSWWLCYRLKLDALAVYVRLAFGGAYDDAEAALPRINDVAASLEELVPAAEAAKEAGRFRGGHRLIVVLDERERNGSYWEIAGAADGSHPSDDPIDDALAFLSKPALSDPDS
jgi:hypothetical protein